MSIRFKAELDTKDLRRQADVAKATTAKALASMVTGMRRTAQLGISLSQAFGGAMSQTAQLGIESALLSIEMVTTTTAAVAAGTFGTVAILQAGARLAAIISMLTLIHQLKQHKQTASTRTQGLVSAFRLLSF